MKDRSAWFWRMRDIRDYIAHHGFVHFHLVESPAGTLQFFIQHRLNMRDLAREFMVGLDEMLFVIDQSFTKRLVGRSEEHTSELQSLMRISYAVFCLKKKNEQL